MAYVKKPIKEDGIVVSKFIKAATKEWTDKEGKLVEGQPEKRNVTVVSACEFDKVTGFEGPTLQTFIVDDETFAKVNFCTKVKVKYYMDNAGNTIPDSIELIQS